MSLRVIAGSAKGRRLKRVPGDSTRPIMDRVKEALFSILGRDIVDIEMIDLFAGTGSVGIEALSRGAAHVTFIDLDKNAIQTIYENLKTTELSEQAVVRRADTLALLKLPPPRPFELIYIAPPQYKDLWIKTMQALDQNVAWLQPEPRVIVQIDPKEEQDVTFEHLSPYDKRTYGRTTLWFFETKRMSDDDE